MRSAMSAAKLAAIPGPGIEHRGNLAHPGRGHVAEDVAVPMHDAPLPSHLVEELGSAFGKPDASVGDDQPDTMQAATPEMLEEPAPAGSHLGCLTAKRVQAAKDEERGPGEESHLPAV